MAVVRLSSTPVGETSRIRAIWVCDGIKAILDEVGIVVGTRVSIILKAYDGTFIIGVRGRRIVIDEELARKIIV
jgi:Fe2+ transport system protein FeoA